MYTRRHSEGRSLLEAAYFMFASVYSINDVTFEVRSKPAYIPPAPMAIIASFDKTILYA